MGLRLPWRGSHADYTGSKSGTLDTALHVGEGGGGQKYSKTEIQRRNANNAKEEMGECWKVGIKDCKSVGCFETKTGTKNVKNAKQYFTLLQKHVQFVSCTCLMQKSYEKGVSLVKEGGPSSTCIKNEKLKH